MNKQHEYIKKRLNSVNGIIRYDEQSNGSRCLFPPSNAKHLKRFLHLLYIFFYSSFFFRSVTFG